MKNARREVRSSIFHAERDGKLPNCGISRRASEKEYRAMLARAGRLMPRCASPPTRERTVAGWLAAAGRARLCGIYSGCCCVPSFRHPQPASRIRPKSPIPSWKIPGRSSSPAAFRPLSLGFLADCQKANYSASALARFQGIEHLPYRVRVCVDIYLYAWRVEVENVPFSSAAHE